MPFFISYTCHIVFLTSFSGSKRFKECLSYILANLGSNEKTEYTTVIKINKNTRMWGGAERNRQRQTERQSHSHRNAGNQNTVMMGEAFLLAFIHYRASIQVPGCSILFSSKETIWTLFVHEIQRKFGMKVSTKFFTFLMEKKQCLSLHFPFIYFLNWSLVDR